MAVNIIKIGSIDAYVSHHAISQNGFRIWLTQAKDADWKTLHDVRLTFPAADPIKNRRIVFDIGGNKFRMICGYHFGAKKATLFVKWIGTHSEYDKLCKQGKQYTVNNY